MGGIVIGDTARIKAIKPLAVNMGSTLDPGAAFLISRGLKTYYLRYERHSKNAQAIAVQPARKTAAIRIPRLFLAIMCFHPPCNVPVRPGQHASRRGCSSIHPWWPGESAAHHR
jgi:hypothetical protein